jgi:hypothetical protein
MIITRDTLASLNFGYLNGIDLLQFCPEELLIKQYAINPALLQTGCNQAYSYLKGKLCNLYDLNKVLSNANQNLKNQTGNISVVIPANTYVSRISLIASSSLDHMLRLTSMTSVNKSIAINPTVSVGTTLNGTDLLENKDVNNFIWFFNKYYTSQTTLYFTIQGNCDINITSDSGVKMPAVSPIGLLNQSGAFQYTIPANTYIYQIFGEILLSTPSVKIGLTPGGIEILPLTLINNTVLPILQQYFSVDTILYFNVSGGFANLSFDLGYNFVAPTPKPFDIKDDTLTEVLSLLALKRILGSLASNNKQLMELFEENKNTILDIQDGTMGLTLPSAPSPLQSIPHTISSSFKVIG